MRHILLYLAVLSSGSLLAQTPCFTPLGLPPISLTIAGLPANGPRWVSSGDLNNDGRADLVVSNGNQTLSILLGNGSGGFGAPTTSISLGNTSDATMLADFDGNGRLDILSVDYGTTQAFRILIGDGLGGFSQGPSPNSPATTLAMAVGDVTGDGRADIVSANSTGQGISIFAGQPFAVFSAPTTINFTIGLPQITLGRIDANTSLDMLIADPLNDNVVRCLNNGSGGFTFDFFGVGDYPTNPVLADVNGDMVNDLLVANRNSATLTVRLNNGTGGFNAATAYEVNNNPNFLTMADVNGDGNLDAVLAAGNVTVKPGNGAGGFGESVIYATAVGGSDPAMVVTPDLTGDSRPDLVTPNGNGVGLAVLLNNGNGSFLGYNTTGSPRNIAIGDLTGDNLNDVVSVAELFNTGIQLIAARSNGTVAEPITLAYPGLITDAKIFDANRDGRNDLIMTKSNGSGNGSLILWPGNGDGTFGTAIEYPVGVEPRKVVLADVNRDNRPDALVLNQTAATVSILLGTDTGFSSFVTAVAPGGVDLLVADLNRDGAADLVTVNQAGGSLLEQYGAGDGTFTGSVTRAVGTADPVAVRAGDLNNDGRVDLAVTFLNTSQVRILRNDGNAGNLPSGAATLIGVNIATGGAALDLALSDLNGDGRLDIALPQRNRGLVQILVNGGSLSFPSSVTYATESGPIPIEAGEIGANTRPGLVIGNSTSRTLTLLTNCTVFPSVVIQPSASLTVTAGQPLSLTATASLFTPTSYT